MAELLLIWRNWKTRQAQTLLEKSVPVQIRLSVFHGDLAERLIAPVLKTGDQETDPRVRIPQSPLLLTCANGKRAHC